MKGPKVLPFLKRKQEAAVAIPVEIESDHDEMEFDHDEMLHHCVDELIESIHHKDKESTLEALKSIFYILDAEPHEEGEHIEHGHEGDEY